MPEQNGLSVHFNLEFLKKEAKALLKQCRSRDHEAICRVRSALPRVSQLDDEHASSEIKLSDVQFALAREHGYANWAILKQTDHQPEMNPDFSSPGSDGRLPEDYVPWRWGVSYTVRPELLSPLVSGQEYLITVGVLAKRPSDETFTGYADLYEHATAIAHARAAALRCPQGGSLHARLLNHTWFRHGSTPLVRAAVTLEITCGKEGDAKPDAKLPPTPEALTSPGGTTIEEAAALPKRTWHEIYSVSELREPPSDKPAIFGFSYGEFVLSCDGLDFKPYVERAEAMTRFHMSFAGGNMGSGNELKIVRREWFCATKPDIAVVHIYVEV
jgi:hypothetical protein